MIVEFAKSFDDRYQALPQALQTKCRAAIEEFLNAYQSQKFPKGLRVHKCGPFLSVSFTMRHRIFVYPIRGGIKFAFVGDHQEMERYLKRKG